MESAPKESWLMLKPSDKRTLRWILIAFISSILINSTLILAELYSTAPYGSITLLLVVPLLLSIPFIFIMLLLMPSLVALFFKGSRRTGFTVIAFCLVYLLTAGAFMRASNWIRMYEFRRLAKRSAPLIMAIRSYEQNSGHPPARVEDLVPKYLPQVPKTGMGAYPEYEYITGKESLAYDGNPWVIVVDTPIGLINWDKFVYFPKQNYPPNGRSGWVSNWGYMERLEDWGYVHE